MFSIVSMQDVLLNLNGSDGLFKQFNRPRSRKRSVSVKPTKERAPPFYIKQIWVLPGHMLVMSEETQVELIAYDQLPKIGPYTNKPKNLLEVIEDTSSGIHDVIYDNHNYQYVYIILKSGLITIYTFVKPAYEWRHILTNSLCKGRGTQISSLAYNQCKKVLVWTEKRSSSQFCICTTTINFTKEDDQNVTVSGIKALLHNCLPMNICVISNDVFCFLPSSPNGLMLFWSMETNKTTVHMWGEMFNEQTIPASTADYQSIVTSSISLWINASNNDNRIISTANHPTTNELVVLQNDLQVHLIRKLENNKINAMFLCNLEVENEKDSFAKQVLALYPVQRFLLVLTMDGIISIFDIRGGLFLWKSTTFKSNSPNIWVRTGPHPTLGVWNKSGIWNLRPKPIAEQMQDFHNKSHPDQKSEENISVKIPDVEFALDVYEEQKKQMKSKPGRRIKQGVNRSSAIPIHYLLQILRQWKLTNLSTDMALTMTLKMKELQLDSVGEDININQFTCLLNEIKDPVLLLVLFNDKNLPFFFRKKLIVKLKEFLEHPSSKYFEDPKILKIFHDYAQTDNTIKEILLSEPSPANANSLGNIIEKEFDGLLLLCMNQHVTVTTLDTLLIHLIEVDSKAFLNQFLSILIPLECLQTSVYNMKAHDEIDEAVKKAVWKTLLRKNSFTLHQVCILLWTQSPAVLLTFLQQAKHVIETVFDFGKDVLSMDMLMKSILQIIYIPLKSSATLQPDGNKELTERVHVYCSCLQMTESDTCEEEAFEIFIQFDMYEKALDILRKYKDNSQKHYSLFFKFFVSLVEKKIVGMYADVLKDVIPEKFNMAELNVVLCSHSLETGNGPVFGKSSKDLTIEMLRPLLNTLLS